MLPRGGTIIKCAREARGMTQEFAANCHGVDVSTISRWERMVMPVSFDDLNWLLTDIFKMTLTEAVELANNENYKRS